jgi:hypothetical protein
MRNWLISIPHDSLMMIAKDLGFEGTFRQDAIDVVVERAKKYGWTVAVLRTRYRLKAYQAASLPPRT